MPLDTSPETYNSAPVEPLLTREMIASYLIREDQAVWTSQGLEMLDCAHRAAWGAYDVYMSDESIFLSEAYENASDGPAFRTPEEIIDIAWNIWKSELL